MKLILATEKHDQALRELAETVPMPGWVQLAYCREPNFFHGLNDWKYPGQVIAAVEDERLLGVGCRTVQSVYVNGQCDALGYLGGLRLLPSVRRTTLLGRGYHFLRMLHDRDKLVPAYLTTIIEDNKQAISLLTSRRAGLPHYMDHGRYITYAILKSRMHGSGANRAWKIKNGEQVPLEEVADFLHCEGARKQFFPAINCSDLRQGKLRGLHPRDFLVALENEKITGVIAAWDQSSFKQYVVRGYKLPILKARPLLNALLRTAHAASLPAPGQNLNILNASFICIRDNNPEILVRLLDALCHQGRGAGSRVVLTGLHESDPLNRAMKSFITLKYNSRLFLAYWQDGINFVERLDPDKIPYLELAML